MQQDILPRIMVAAGVCDQALIQVAYAIGVAEPVGLFINTFGYSKGKRQQRCGPA